MYKVLVIFGTRPEAIKMAPLIKELKSRPAIDLKVCITAQHRDLLDQVLENYSITPDYDLNIMKQNQTLEEITSRVLTGVGSIIEEIKPDIVLVHGDTTTSFAAALSAFYHQVLIGHIEAGLRTYDKYQPFPEELNRQMISNLADLNFAPTKLSYQNLKNEQKDLKGIFVTGNTAIDAMKLTIKKDYQNEEIPNLDSKKTLLLTMHRRENLGEPMKNVFRAVKKIVNEYNCQVVFPVHPNPIIRKLAEQIFQGDPNIKLIKPLEVSDFHNLQNKSYLILTDSGGIQEEAPSLGKPVLVLRNTTERPEGIEAGTLKLVGTDEDIVYQNIKTLLEDQETYNKMSQAKNPYGDGLASKRITDIILGVLENKELNYQDSVVKYLKEHNYSNDEIRKIINVEEI